MFPVGIWRVQLDSDGRRIGSEVTRLSCRWMRWTTGRPLWRPRWVNAEKKQSSGGRELRGRRFGAKPSSLQVVYSLLGFMDFGRFLGLDHYFFHGLWSLLGLGLFGWYSSVFAWPVHSGSECIGGWGGLVTKYYGGGGVGGGNFFPR